MEQIFGNHKKVFNSQLDIFKKYGVTAAITDFAVLLGGWVENTPYGGRYEYSKGWYWSKN